MRRAGSPRPLLLCCFRLGLGLVVVGLIDLAYARWQFRQQMMMSRREMKEEVKRTRRRPADPRTHFVNCKRENLKQAKALGRLPDADVLITNPTHLAIALRYDRQTMHAPVVLAKGADKWANELKALARPSWHSGLRAPRSCPRACSKRGVLDHAVPMECFLRRWRVCTPIWRSCSAAKHAMRSRARERAAQILRTTKRALRS